jgi:hypothetical protein
LQLPRPYLIQEIIHKEEACVIKSAITAEKWRIVSKRKEVNAMPGLNGTGPQGARPMTGRGFGNCNRVNQLKLYGMVPGYRGVSGTVFMGRGCGWRNRYYATGVPGSIQPTPEQEIANLNAWAEQLKTQLDAIQKRIAALKS